MAKEKKIHQGWRRTCNERFRYYSGDTGRPFESAIIKDFSSIFLLFQDIDLTLLADIILMDVVL